MTSHAMSVKFPSVSGNLWTATVVHEEEDKLWLLFQRKKQAIRYLVRNLLWSGTFLTDTQDSTRLLWVVKLYIRSLSSC